MAVESQPPPVQPAGPRLTMTRDFIQVIGAAAALAAVIIAGMALVVSITVAPVREEMRLLREDMRLLHTAMQRGFEAVDSEFKAVRGEMANLRQDMNDGTTSSRLSARTWPIFASAWHGWKPCLSGIRTSQMPRVNSRDRPRIARARRPTWRLFSARSGVRLPTAGA